MKLNIPSVIKIMKEVIGDRFNKENQRMITSELKAIKKEHDNNHTRVTIHDYWRRSIACYTPYEYLTKLRNKLFETFNK